jgi:asparagine synthase (glutamine-hydrolysing)
MTMCGISGVVRIDGQQLGAGTRLLLDRMADSLAHRGPDDRELLLDGPVGMAFTRLSLVDPAGGRQPLVSDDGSLVLIANGEVYNHRELAAKLPGVTLRTGSDCEILLYLYRERGLDFLDDVRGMFGLILWDRHRRQLVLARDRFGIKPLYYHRDRSRIVLGSEITSLFADPATPRAVDWGRALATPLLAAEPCLNTGPLTTWFADIESVPAGTVLRIDLDGGATSVHPYWRFPGPARAVPHSIDELVEEYRSLLVQSVTECATADTELGLFLSGGVDSAAVAAIAAGQGHELHTFTALSPSTYLGGDAEHSHRLAAKLGLPNHQVVFDADRVPGPAEWKRLLWLVETPLCGPEVYFKHELHRYAKIARPELRGMLLGAASDEFNGGYSTTIADGGDWSGFLRGLGSLGHANALRARPDLRHWWSANSRPLFADDAIRQFCAHDETDAYAAYLESEYWKIQQYNVWHEDRTAGGSGIEARVPFLDHRLVELVAAVPEHLRRPLLWDKRILRAAMRGTVPEEVAERPKVAFYYGDGVHHTYRTMVRMLAHDGAALVEEALSAPGADALIDGAAVRDALRRAAAHPDTPQLEVALQVVNLGLLAGMVADLPAPTIRTPIGAPPPAIEVSHWDDERAEIERRIGLRPRLAHARVPRLAEGVLVLSDTSLPDVWYVAVDGAIEYVLDDDEPEFREVLGATDGRRTLAEIAAATGRSPDDVTVAVADLVARSVLVLD